MHPYIVESSNRTNAQGKNEHIFCHLPKDYIKRGFNADDTLTVKVSVDNLNWIYMGEVSIVKLKPLSLSPIQLENRDMNTITIETTPALSNQIFS